MMQPQTKWFISNEKVSELLTYIKGEKDGTLVCFNNEKDAISYRDDFFPDLIVLPITVDGSININPK
jgi:hypothetical protein